MIGLENAWSVRRMPNCGICVSACTAGGDTVSRRRKPSSCWCQSATTAPHFTAMSCHAMYRCATLHYTSASSPLASSNTSTTVKLVPSTAMKPCRGSQWGQRDGLRISNEGSDHGTLRRTEVMGNKTELGREDALPRHSTSTLYNGQGAERECTRTSAFKAPKKTQQSAGNV